MKVYPCSRCDLAFDDYGEQQRHVSLDHSPRDGVNPTPLEIDVDENDTCAWCRGVMYRDEEGDWMHVVFDEGRPIALAVSCLNDDGGQA